LAHDALALVKSAPSGRERREDHGKVFETQSSHSRGRLSQEPIMKAMKNLLGKLVKDEQGGEVLEYALIAGLIVVAAIAVIGAVGSKVVAKWTSLNSSL
jgi:pilus assembly protein Flp/PilA